MNMKNVALFAGLFFILLATFTQGILPALQPETTQTKVTKVVRTDLGELKWMMGNATDYTEIQARGRKVYIREGCWYCHSQYVRPVAGESRRWGPVSQSGEYAFDLPHMLSTRRIGPDLTRVGLKYSDGWHLAHFWDPRILSPDSIMPKFSSLFDGPRTASLMTDDNGNLTIEPDDSLIGLFDFKSSDMVYLTPNLDGLTYVPESGKYPIIHTPNDEFSGQKVRLIAPADDLTDLIAYVQKLGMNRGKWRDRFEPQRLTVTTGSMPRSEEWIEYGQDVFRRRCAGCHGDKGDGNGPAATFFKARPRNFNAGSFKFRLTPSGSLPTDGDLMRTINRGIRGTAMPPFYNLAEKDKIAVVQYIKYVMSIDNSDPDYPYAYFEEEEFEAPIYVGNPPQSSKNLIETGKVVWQAAKCWECHGDDGRGDGKKAAGLEDDFGFGIPPADLTAGLFKSGSDAGDIYRTITTGLNGTPMPSYGDSFSDEDRWALAYFVTSLSAFTDPLSGEHLKISPEDREVLNDPELKAPSSDTAYMPASFRNEQVNALFAGSAWASRHGLEQAGEAAKTDENESVETTGDSND